MKKNGVICLVFFFPSWVMVLKLPKIMHFLQICAALSKKSKSVCNFQSMKRPVELNSLLSKFFCYTTWFVISPDETWLWTTCKRGLYVKSYYFFETIQQLKITNWNLWKQFIYIYLKDLIMLFQRIVCFTGTRATAHKILRIKIIKKVIKKSTILQNSST